MTEPLPSLSYEVHVKRGPRQWTVVEVFAEREAALDFARTQQPAHHAVRVTIERYDERTNTYQSTIAYEWVAPKRLRPSPGVTVRSERIVPPPSRPPAPPKKTIGHYLALLWRWIVE